MKRIRILVLVLVVMLVVALLMAKTMLGGVDRQSASISNSAARASAIASVPIDAAGGNTLAPEDQFNAALSAHKPTLALFHSLTCIPCMAMAATVEEVRPDYEGKVTFVDVDVYDTANTNFCRSARIQVIPTTVLVNARGEESRQVGAIEADQLRDMLNQLLAATPSS